MSNGQWQLVPGRWTLARKRTLSIRFGAEERVPRKTRVKKREVVGKVYWVEEAWKDTVGQNRSEI